MGVLKYAILGVAAVYGFKYATKKRSTDGKSLADDFREKASGYLDHVKDYGERIKQNYSQTSELY